MTRGSGPVVWTRRLGPSRPSRRCDGRAASSLSRRKRLDTSRPHRVEQPKLPAERRRVLPSRASRVFASRPAIATASIQTVSAGYVVYSAPTRVYLGGGRIKCSVARIQTAPSSSLWNSWADKHCQPGATTALDGSAQNCLPLPSPRHPLLAIRGLLVRSSKLLRSPTPFSETLALTRGSPGLMRRSEGSPTRGLNGCAAVDPTFASFCTTAIPPRAWRMRRSATSTPSAPM